MSFKKKLSRLVRYGPWSFSFFNNTLSLRFNVLYYIFWVISKFKYSRHPLLFIFSPKLNLPPKGYRVIHGAISENTAEALSSQISTYKNLNPNLFESNLSYHFRLLYPLKTLGITIDELFSNNEAVDIINSIVGSNFRVVWIDCYRTTSVEQAKTEQSWLWHTDNTPVGSLKCMIALTDISSKSGAMSYLNRESTLANRRAGYHGDISSTRTSTLPIKDSVEQFLTAPKGSFILFDNNNLHKANIPQTGFRDVMTCLIIPSKNYSDRRFDVSINPDHIPGPFPTNPFATN